MRCWLRLLPIILLLLAVPLSANALTWTPVGTNGILIANDEIFIDSGADGKIEVADFTINGDGYVHFVEYGPSDTYLIASKGDIVIDGSLDALGHALFLESAGTITLNGNGVIAGSTLRLSAANIVINGELHTPAAAAGGAITLSATGNAANSAGSVLLNSGSGIRVLTYTPDGTLVAGSLQPMDVALIENPGGMLTLSGSVPAPVPEPSTLFLLGAGLAGMAGMKRRIGV